ncbi:MAG: DUF2460 domain-containing protein [Clostridia bacterium]|nr:DUF2460 domain-containing protein [Clostridia bacterium]
MSDRILNSIGVRYDYGWAVSVNFRTDVSQLGGGGEQRRARWEFPLRRFKIPYNNKYITNLKKLIQFFIDHKGQYESFYFHDTTSRQTETIASTYKQGDPVTKIFLIHKPVVNATEYPIVLRTSSDISLYNVIVKIDGIVKPNNQMSIAPLTGEISFTSNQPNASQEITVEYDYLTRVRFATDIAEFTENTFNVGSSSIELAEERA